MTLKTRRQAMEGVQVEIITNTIVDVVVIEIINNPEAMSAGIKACGKRYQKYKILNLNAKHPYKPALLLVAKKNGKIVGTLGVYDSPIPATNVYRHRTTGEFFYADNIKEAGVFFFQNDDILEQLVRTAVWYHRNFILTGGITVLSSQKAMVKRITKKIGEDTIQILDDYEIVEENVPLESKGFLEKKPALYKMNLNVVLAKSI